MAGLLDEVLALVHWTDIRIFVGDGHYAGASMVEGMRARNLHLVSKPRRGPTFKLEACLELALQRLLGTDGLDRTCTNTWCPAGLIELGQIEPAPT